MRLGSFAVTIALAAIVFAATTGHSAHMETSTLATYTDTVTTVASISGQTPPAGATTLKLEAGTARARVRGSKRPPLVSRLDRQTGDAVLDFGQLRAGESICWSDVVRLRNVSGDAVAPTWVVSGPVTSVFDTVSLRPHRLASGHKGSLAVRLSAAHANPGAYEGTITFQGADGSAPVTAQVKVTVVGRRSHR